MLWITQPLSVRRKISSIVQTLQEPSATLVSNQQTWNAQWSARQPIKMATFSQLLVHQHLYSLSTKHRVEHHSKQIPGLDYRNSTNLLAVLIRISNRLSQAKSSRSPRAVDAKTRIQSLMLIPATLSSLKTLLTNMVIPIYWISR